MTTTSAAPPVPLPFRGRLRPRARARGALTFKYGALLVFAVVVLLPVYVLLVTSFKGVLETDPSHAWSLPHTWTVTAWRQAWDQLSPNLGNSFKLVIPATAISVILGSSRLIRRMVNSGVSMRRSR